MEFLIRFRVFYLPCFQENPKAVSVLFMVMSSILALVTSVLCYQVINKNFSYDENVGAKYVLLILIPTLVIFGK